MTRATRPLNMTVEEQLRTAHGVLQLVADLLELQAVASDYLDHGLSSGAATTLSGLCREQGTDLERLRVTLPTEMLNTDPRTGRFRLCLRL